MKYCINCGTSLNDDDIFCEKCGAKQIEIVKKIQPENNMQGKKQVNTNSNSYTQARNVNASQNQHAQARNINASQNQYAQARNVNASQNQYAQAGNVNAVPNQYAQTGNVNASQNQYAQAGNVNAVPNQYAQTGNVNATPNQYAQAGNVNNNLPINKKKPNLKIIIPLIAAMVIVIAGVIVYMQFKKRVDVNQYVTVNFKGYNGVGKAQVNIDKDGLAGAIKKAGGIYSDLDNCLEFSCDKSSDLSNGDTVKIQMKEKKNGSLQNVKLIFSEKEQNVEGLQDAKTVDVFDNVNIKFSGVSPDVKLTVKNDSTDSYLQTLAIKASKTSGIKSGDKITLKINVDTKEALKNGYIISETEKTVECNGIDSYLNDLSAISDAQMEELKKSASDVLEATYAKKSITASDYNYEGAYLQVNKSTSATIRNKLYIIYTVTITAKESYSGSKTVSQKVYVPVGIKNVLMKSGNKLSYDSSFAITGSSVKVGYNTYVDGYKDGPSMYKAIITANKDQYTYSSVGNVETFKDEDGNTTSYSYDSDYVLPQSNKRKLTEADLASLTKDELRLARNEISARHGRKFKDQTLQDYFNSKSWYKGTIEPDDFRESLLNDYEMYNQTFILEYENR